MELIGRGNHKIGIAMEEDLNTEQADLKPAFIDHEFLELLPPDCEAYNFTYPMVATYHEKYFHVGSACLIGERFAITAKHILEYMFMTVAGKKIDMYDPDILSSPHGHRFPPPEGMEIHLLQFINSRGDARRYGVTGIVGVGYKESDLLILEIAPHPACPHRAEPMPKSPVLEVGCPKVGNTIYAFGYPEHPDYKLEAHNAWLSNNWLYASTGIVTKINFERGSTQFISYDSSARTMSGMSGGPVFTKREDGLTFCGVIGRGGPQVDYSVIAPLWLIATACADKWPGMPEKEGFTWLAELMKDGTIPTKGAEHLRIDYDELKVVFDDPLNVRNGY